MGDTSRVEIVQALRQLPFSCGTPMQVAGQLHRLPTEWISLADDMQTHGLLTYRQMWFGSYGFPTISLRRDGFGCYCSSRATKIETDCIYCGARAFDPRRLEAANDHS